MKKRDDADFNAEIHANIAIETDRLIADGLSPAQAKAAALRAFGNVTHAQERFYEANRTLWLDDLRRDVRYALRNLVAHPGFTLVAVLTLALGIGANAAIFSVVDGVLLRPAPFEDLDRLMMVWGTDVKSGTTREPVSIPDYFDFHERSAQFSSLAAVSPIEVNLTHPGTEPRRLAGLVVTHDFTPLIGVRPILGRAIEPAEDRPGAASVAVISEDLWESLFARDATVLGRQIRLNDFDRTIVGVMPRAADFGTLQVLAAADYGRGFVERGGRLKVDVWLPMRADRAVASRSSHPIFVLGRLGHGASALSAQEEMAAISTELERAYPDSNTARGSFVEPLEAVVFEPVRPALYVLLAAVALVLLVACVNVANLLLVRAAARGREVAVRMALGAGVGRLTRQFVVEGAMLAGSGAALGVLFAYQAQALLVAMAPASLPRIDFVTVDARVLVVTLAAAVLVASAFGLLPALHVRANDLQGALRRAAGRQASSERTWLRSALVVGELAMTITLMVGAGLLMRSMWDLSQVDPGFQSAGVLKAEFQLPAARYPEAAQRSFHDAVTGRLAALPGVDSVALAAYSPMNAGFTSSIRVAGREAEARDWPEPSVRIVSASYFDTLRVALQQGRRFEPTDTQASDPVVVINAAAEQRYFAGGDAVGQAIFLWGALRNVVGIVANERFKGLAQAPPPAVYLPTTQIPSASAVLVRTTRDAAAVAPEVRQVIRELDPQLPLFGVEPLDDTLANSQVQRRFTMIVLVAFAGVALLLSIVGMHGVVSQAVAQRTQEIGIRMALGARASEVVSLVLRQSAGLIGAGLLLGLGGALAVTRYLEGMLFGITPLDPLTFVLAAVLFAAVAMLASYLPARRATRVDPLMALRCD